MGPGPVTRGTQQHRNVISGAMWQCQCQMCHVGGGVTLSQHWHPSLVSLQLLCPHLRVSNPLHILSLVIIRQCQPALMINIQSGIYNLHQIYLSICPSHTRGSELIGFLLIAFPNKEFNLILSNLLFYRHCGLQQSAEHWS